MKWIISVLTILLFPSWTATFAQTTFDCKTILAAFENTYPEEKISNTNDFCTGVTEASEAIELGLKWHVNQFELGPCILHSFERHKIKIIGTGTTQLPAVVDANNGYNFVMQKRIVNHIGQKAFDRLGKEDNSYFSLQDFFDGDFQKKLNKNLIRTETLMGKIKLKLNKEETDFAKYVSQMKVVDVQTNKVFFFGDLYTGVALDITSKDEVKQQKELRFFLTSVKDPKFCIYKNMPKIRTIRVNLDNYFNQWKWAEDF